MDKTESSTEIVPGNRQYTVHKKLNTDRSVTYTFKDENGDSQMTVFTVFPGIKLMYHAVHTDHSFLGACKKGNLIEIHHCYEGRIERPHRDTYFYLMPGDLSINIVNRKSVEYSFPLRHYHGITISIDVDVVPKCFSCFMKDVSIRPANVAKRLCGDKDCFVIRSENYIEHLFSELYNVPCKDKVSYFKIKILELLLILSGVDPEENKLSKYTVSKVQVKLAKRVAAYLQDNNDNKITVQNLCEKFHVSATHLQNAFKGVFGVPVYSYVRIQKIQFAAMQLIQTDRSVIEIANESGYDNASKFASAFREIMGETPLEYRKMHSV